MQKEITEYLVNLVILDRLDLHEYRCVAPGETTDGAPIQICLFLCVQDGIQKQPKLPSRRSRKEAWDEQNIFQNHHPWTEVDD